VRENARNLGRGDDEEQLLAAGGVDRARHERYITWRSAIGGEEHHLLPSLAPAGTIVRLDLVHLVRPGRIAGGAKVGDLALAGPGSRGPEESCASASRRRPFRSPWPGRKRSRLRRRPRATARYPP
jgi:hypothetical protein